MNTKIKTAERVERIVLAIGKEILPRRGIIDALQLRQKSRRNFCENYLYPAIGLGLVQMTYPEVPSKPEQAYLLTEKGLEFLEKLEERAKKEQA